MELTSAVASQVGFVFAERYRHFSRVFDSVRIVSRKSSEFAQNSLTPLELLSEFIRLVPCASRVIIILHCNVRVFEFSAIFSRLSVREMQRWKMDASNKDNVPVKSKFGLVLLVNLCSQTEVNICT